MKGFVHMKIFVPPYMSESVLETIIGALPGSRNKDFMKSAEDIINKNAYAIPPFGVTKYKNLVDWNDGRSRSYNRLIHGHTFLGCLTDAYSKTSDIKYINKSMQIIRDWIMKHDYKKHKDTMAFHDETTALRLKYWLKFYIYARDKVSSKDSELIETKMWETADLLSQEFFHSTNTNHGMFQDIALLLFSIYFYEENTTKCEKYKQLSISRLRDYFSFVFTEEGVHKEHSPSYHLLVTNYVKRLAKWLSVIDLNTSKEFNEICRRAEEFVNYIVRPDGKLPPIGDTEPKPVNSTSRKLFNSQEFKYAISAGREGKPPKDVDKVFMKSGYAIFRDDWNLKEKGTYILFSASYHGNYHKHSDDLSVYIYSGGEIITEAGPNGYNYQDSFTKYAYSSFAHNTLIVNGNGLPRTDNKIDKVKIVDHKIENGFSEAIGINNRYEGVSHTRKVNYNKNEQKITVDDSVVSEKNKEYKLLWHLAKGIKAHARDKIIELYRNNKKVMEIEVISKESTQIKIIEGQSRPEVQGWKFPRMEHKEAIQTIEVEFNGKDVDISTIFRLSQFRIDNGERSPFNLEKVYKSNPSLRYHFEPAKDSKFKDQLVVVFSAIAPRYKFVYNYVNTLKDIPINKLFILDDFGDQGSYYLAKNRDFSIETAVSSLINYKMAKYGINSNNVTTVGSSKGGFAALYYGIKYHFGNVIVGAPQTKLGHFLINQAKHRNVAEYISGGYEKSHQYYLDRLLFNLLDLPNDASPNINILIGKQDHHYTNHFLPFANELKRKGFKLNLDIREGIPHSDLRLHFPPYLINKIRLILGLITEDEYKKLVLSNSSPLIRKVEINKLDNNMIEVKCNASGKNIKYAYYIYKDNTILEKIPYGQRSTLIYEIKDIGSYKVRVFVRDANNKTIAMTTNNIIINKNY